MSSTTTKRVAGNRAPALGLALAVLLAALLLSAQPAHARTFTVDLTADFPDPNPEDDTCIVSIFGGCTLRAAIEQANATRGADTINFNIPSGDANCDATTKVCTISPDSELPYIADTLIINGYSQPAATPNTNPTLSQGTNANPLVEVGGTDAGQFAAGLLIKSTAPKSVVRGLIINRFDGNGIFIEPGGKGNRIEGNFIGTDPDGEADLGNSGSGVAIGGFTGGNNTVGGTTPASRNVISGNASSGVSIGSSGNRVIGNYIGSGKDGVSDLGNSGSGVGIAHFGNTVGGVEAANIIAFNGGDGVAVFNAGATGNRILSNSIFSNGALGIDLDNNGPTPDDPRDPDSGPNRLQNFPVLDTATAFGDLVKIEGTLNSTPSTRRKKKSFTIQFFSSSQADPSGFGEGETFLGQKSVTTDRQGNRSFSFVFTPAQRVAVGDEITATATRNSTGDTSEFSNAVSAEPL